MDFKDRPWYIISKFDLEGTDGDIYKDHIKRSKSSLERSRYSAERKHLKKMPKKIEDGSRVLTPTQSSLNKRVKKMTKSKSGESLNWKKREEFKKGLKEKDKEAGCRKLEIDIEKVEEDYRSPDLFKATNLDTFEIESFFTVKEAISSDLITGKVFSSMKVIQVHQLRGRKSFVKPRKKIMPFIEVQLPIEFHLDSWQFFSNTLFKVRQKALISVLRSMKPTRKKYKKSSIKRPARTLANLSRRLNEIISSNLKPEVTLKSLVEQEFSIKKLPLHYPPQYTQSQDFLLALVLLIWNCPVKPLTLQNISIFTEADRLISDLSKLKDPTLRLQNLLSLVPLLLITSRFNEASEYLKQATKGASNNKTVFLWAAWLEILTSKNTNSNFYALSEISAPANYSIHYKLALVYSYYFSCVFLNVSRTISFLKGLEMGEWESAVLVDVMMRSGDKVQEDEAVKLMKSMLQDLNIYIKFLGFYRLFRVYKSYNQLNRAWDLLKSVQKLSFSDEMKVLLECCSLKILANMKQEMKFCLDVPLVKYQYSRLSIKHSLTSPLDKVLQYLNESCSYSQIYSLTTCQFTVNFWKFLLFNQLKLHKMAVSQAQIALEFENADRIKQNSVHESLKNLNSLENLINDLNTKDQGKCVKIAENIEKFDDFLGTCIKVILFKSLKNKEKIPIHKFEGCFAIWTVLYRNLKHKEKQFTALDGQEEIDKRDKMHPLHIISKLRNDWRDVLWMHENSVSIPVSILWVLFGKQIGNLQLKDAYRVMQAKSYLRTSVPRALKKLEKASKSSIVSYYQAKISISLIKFQKSASDLNFQRISMFLKEFVLSEDMSKEYKVKVLYLQAELAFMIKNYQGALSLLNEAEEYSKGIGSDYLNKQKRALSLDIVRSRMSQ